MPFDAGEYRRKLIEGGLDAEQADRLIAKMVVPDGAKTAGPQSIEKTVKPRKRPARSAAARNAVGVQSPAPTAELSSPPEHSVISHNKVDASRGADCSQQGKQSELVKQTKQKIKEFQLSLFDIAPWANDMRAMPNDWLRSALFTTRNKRAPRLMMEKAPIYHVQKDVSITYTGWELRADDDELVLHQVLEYAKRVPVGEPATFSFYEICHDLDWPINKFYYDRVDACLTRLQASAMQFYSDRIGRLESLSLIRRFRILEKGNKRKQRCQVEIDEEIVVLFAGGHYTKFVWDKYRKLSPTARRMFDYFATHREPYPISLEKFRLMCGSDSARLNKWREQARKAAEELCESGLVNSAWVDGDRVYCQR